MPRVTIYTTVACGYCYEAKQLLRDKGVGFDEIRVTLRPALRRAMSKKANGRTSVPQIFVGERHVGGCDDLLALERHGELDRVLQSSQA